MPIVIKPPSPILVFFSFLFCVILPATNAQFTPTGSWTSSAVQFEFQPDLSDEFDGDVLDTSKWDPHGLRNPETNCPRWNGPVHSDYPDDSTFYPGSTNPSTGESSVKFYSLSDGYLRMKVEEQPLSFFTDREYYCNATTFHCNHNPKLPCFLTTITGEPIYIDEEKTQYKALVHDKCKIEPYCIPHPIYVSGKTEKDRQYYRLASTHLTSKQRMQYGFLETKVHLGDSPAVAAVWLHDDDMVNGYCRYRKSEGPGRIRIECPSFTRSRRWQEIDLMEAMNSTIHSTRYVPNIHAFAMHKGEFTSKEASEFSRNDGNGGGPIIIKGVFNENKPSFSDVSEEKRIENDWHWSPGSIATLDAPWASSERILGLYWSPNEIRFFVDGIEVERIKNSLIHQPMFIDISYGLNTKWAMESPTKEQLEEEAKIDYIRVWKVLTPDGEDVPSDLPQARDDMEKEFKNIYGIEEFGVFDRFPVNDSVELFPFSESIADALPSIEREVVEQVRTEADFFDDTFEMTDRQKKKKFKPTGGKGNRRKFGRRGSLPKRLREGLLSSSTRASLVFEENKTGRRGKKFVSQGKNKKGENIEVEILENPERTIFEHDNPNNLLGGWALLNDNDNKKREENFGGEGSQKNGRPSRD